MSGSDHAILDLGTDDDLQFTTNNYKSGDGQNDPGMTAFPTPTTERDTSQLIDEDGASGPSDWKTSNFWTFAFYQQFFDIDTVDVKNRVLYSMVPMPGKSFLQYHIRPRPDLYGPFWICVTLVFSIAISGNMADYLQKSFQAYEEHQPLKWHYDFHKVSLAAMVVFSYASLLPAGLYGVMWWAGAGQVSSSTISFVELVCLYGYSLTIYVPVSLLWLIQITWWQWICVLVGAGLSGAVLFTPIWPAVKHQASRAAVIIMIVIVLLHLLLAVGFMLYFFHVPSSSVTPPHGKNETVVVPPVNDKLEKNASVIDQDKPADNVEEAKNQSASEENSDNKRDTDNNNPPNQEQQVKQDNKTVEIQENPTDTMEHEVETTV